MPHSAPRLRAARLPPHWRHSFSLRQRGVVLKRVGVRCYNFTSVARGPAGPAVARVPWSGGIGDVMNSIALLLQSGGVDRSSSMNAAMRQLLVLVFLQSAAAKSDVAVTAELTKVFLDNDDLRDEFVLRYGQEMRKGSEPPNDGIAVENGLHNALVGTILAHRDLFPTRAFSVKTDLGGGDSIATEIPAIGSPANTVQSGSSAAVNKLVSLLSALKAEGASHASEAAAARAYGALEG